MTNSYMIAYHGTPYEVDSFDTAKIGDGEGIQVYGHGLYFAGDHNVAEFYRKSLSGDENIAINGIPLVSQSDALSNSIRNILKNVENGMSFDKAKSEALEDLMITKAPSDIRAFRELEKINEKDISKIAGGNIYTVLLKPTEDEYLYWDKPLSEQSNKVKAMVAGEKAKNFSHYIASAGGYKNGKITASGKTIYEAFVSMFGSSGEASEHMLGCGIKGIKYVDGNTRRPTGEQVSHNYVVFHNNDVEIVKKNGLDYRKKA
jgi:hypothetical protein